MSFTLTGMGVSIVRLVSRSVAAHERTNLHLPPIRILSSPLTETLTERVIDTHHHISCGVVGRLLMGLLATASLRLLPSPSSSSSTCWD